MERTRTIDGEAVSTEPPFSAFYREHFPGAVTLAHALAGGRRAEDIAQDALLAVYRKWGELDRPERWLRRVIANRSRSALRRGYAEARALAKLYAPPAQPEVPAETEYFWALVRKLPRRQAQVFALRHLDELSAAEVAGVLEISETTVRVHLHRARQTLASQLGDTT